jgi:putative FmdB family regulatory protein
MPTYDYECDSCGTMEVSHSMKAPTMTACPNCGSTDFRKLVSSGAGIIFKGEGFWETDYNRSDDYQKAAKADSDTSSGAGTSDAGKGSDAKPAATETKADSKPASTSSSSTADSGGAASTSKDSPAA